MGTFVRQFRALAWKNLLVLFQHPLVRPAPTPTPTHAYTHACAHPAAEHHPVVPAPRRLRRLPRRRADLPHQAELRPSPSLLHPLRLTQIQLGLGSARPIAALADVYDGATPLYWASAPGLDTRTNPALTPAAIVAQLTAGFSPAQRAGVVQVGSPDDIAPKCPQNFNGFSECFAAVVFNAFPSMPLSAGLNGTSAGGASRTNTTSSAPGVGPNTNAVNYTLRADGGLYHIDVRGRSDYERRVLPLQRALDGAITRLAANTTTPVPLEWPFTRETNAQQALYTRLSASVTCSSGWRGC
jgi:hypothetical protein